MNKNSSTGSFFFIFLPLLSADIQETHTASAKVYGVSVLQCNPRFGNRNAVHPDAPIRENIENRPQTFICAFEHRVNRADPFTEQTEICRAGAPDQVFPVMHRNVLFACTQISPGLRLRLSAEQRAQVPDQDDDRQEQD